MKKLLIALTCMTLSSVTAHASVTLDIEGGTLRTSTGTVMNDNGLIILVASTTANGFTSTFDGTASTAVGTFLTADDQIIASFSVNSAAGNGAGGFSSLTGLTYSGMFSSLAGGQSLQMYWFPTLTTSSTTFGVGTSYGSYRTDSALDGASSGWFLPNDGTPLTTITFYTQSASGSVADSFGNANLTTVPEPATTVALLGGAAGLFVMHRRRQRKAAAPVSTS
ncbi:MAG: PEP-CTERM sorting domain-containing protein [Nibricoccus sp.]